MEAAENGHSEVLRMLLDAGALVNMRDKVKHSAIHLYKFCIFVCCTHVMYACFYVVCIVCMYVCMYVAFLVFCIYLYGKTCRRVAVYII